MINNVQEDIVMENIEQRRTEQEFPGAHQLPEDGFLRLHQIVGKKKATPPIPAIIPVCSASWWAGCKSGKYPKPLKLGPRTTVWRVKDIRALIASA